jgi:MYXO-CTERM domain-containing protein
MVSVLTLIALSPAHALEVVPSTSTPTLADALAVVSDGETIRIEAPLPAEGALSAPANRDFTINGNNYSFHGTTIDVPSSTTLEIFDVNNDCLSGSSSAPAITGEGVVTVDNSYFACYGDGVIEMQVADLTVTNSTFQNNVGAISLIESDLWIESTDVLYNASNGGAVVSARGGGNVTILGELADNPSGLSRFNSNIGVGTDGSALFVQADTVFIGGVEFSNNTVLDIALIDETANNGDTAGFLIASGRGGAAFIDDFEGSEVSLWGNTFSGNLAWEGGGLYMQDVQYANVYNNLFAGNWSYHLGGGVYHVTTDAFDTSPPPTPVIPTSWFDPDFPPDFAQEPTYINNTFVGNTAGLTQSPETIVVVGGGGGGVFHGFAPDFRNNIVSHTYYGGGILLHDGPNFVQGDDLNWEYNLWYWNCDLYQCQPQFVDDQRNVTSNGEQSGYPLHPNNIVESDPQYYYFGDVRQGIIDFDAFPDVFCTDYDSPAVRNGDPSEEQPTSIANTNLAAYSDIGICGGVLADIQNPDRDGDGFEAYYDCLDEPGHPASTETFPDAQEDCDFEDNDCDGTIDEGFITTWYDDADGDGYGDIGEGKQPQLICPGEADPDDVSVGGDCDDNDPSVNEGASEICDGIDNDCNQVADQGELEYVTVYRDTDGDGYGAPSAPRDACFNSSRGSYYEAVGTESLPLASDNWVPNALDCDDSDPTVNPDAVEDCSIADRNCNGDSYDADDAPEYFVDSDGDGYGAGEPNTGTHACEVGQLPELTEGQWVTLGQDCNESDPGINPAAIETCDGFDNDCDTRIDIDPEDAPLLYEDYDNDGYGNPATALRSCDPGPTYTTAVGGDCDDSDPTVGECSECGCQATPTPASTGGLLLMLTGLLGLRRRR